MDVTSLNVFQYCKWLRHLGKGVMALTVGGIVALAAFAVFDTALAPGLRSDSAAAQAGYALLTVTYACVVCMVVWCYSATMFVDPGGVPPGWHPFAGDADGLLDAEAQERHAAEYIQAAAAAAGGAGAAERARTFMERPRWCKKCKAWKPPRAHHCSVSGRCVLKMDHYCVWVANTVGLLNYKAFVLFLCWALAGCLLSAALLVRPCVRFFAAADPAVRPMVVSFLAFVFTAAFTLALLAFVIMHLRLAAANQTTIEAYEKRSVRPWPYDRGARENLTQVFGRRRWARALPVLTPEEQRALAEPYLDVRLPLLLGGAGGGFGGGLEAEAEAERGRRWSSGLRRSGSGVGAPGADVPMVVVHSGGAATVPVLLEHYAGGQLSSSDGEHLA